MNTAQTTRSGPPVVLDWLEGHPRPSSIELLEQARLTDSGMSFAAPPSTGTPLRTWTVEVRSRLHRAGQRKPGSPALGAVVTIDEWTRGTGSLNVVVAPDHRSMGLATALFEELGADVTARTLIQATGLADLVCCSFGTHPAGVRLARRFGASVRAHRHSLIAPSSLSEDAGRRSAPTRGCAVLAGAGRLRARPVWDAATGGAEDTYHRLRIESPQGSLAGHVCAQVLADGSGVIHDLEEAPGCGPPMRRCVVAAAIGWLRANEATAVEGVVDDADTHTLSALRDAGFRHDRSDTLYGEATGAGPARSVRTLARHHQA